MESVFSPWDLKPGEPVRKLNTQVIFQWQLLSFYILSLCFDNYFLEIVIKLLSPNFMLGASYNIILTTNLKDEYY